MARRKRYGQPPIYGSGMVVVQVRFTPYMVALIDKEVKDGGMYGSRSSLVRDALRRFLSG